MLEFSLPEIAEAARKNRIENEEWAKKIKTQYSSAQFDAKVHELTKEVSAQIDCLACGNCCKKLMPSVAEDEVARLAEAKKISSETFIAQFLQWESVDRTYFTRQSPCGLLEGNACTVYPARPQSCCDYPNLYKTQLKYRLKSILQNYGVCPIVYQVVERLKAEDHV